MKLNKSTLIIGGIIAVGLLVVLALVAFKNAAPGVLIGGGAGLWAAIKARIFGPSAAQIKQEHAQKRLDWADEKEQYDNRLAALRARMEYLDYKSAVIAMQLGDLDDEQKVRLEKVRTLPENEKLELFRQLFPSSNPT